MRKMMILASVLVLAMTAGAQTRPIAPVVASNSGTTAMLAIWENAWVVDGVPMLAGATLPAATHYSTLAWTNPNGTNGTVAVYAASGQCPGSGIPTGATLLTSTAPAAGPYTDLFVTAAQTRCYYVEAVVNGVSSVPSNTVSGTTPVFPVTNVSVAQGTSETQAVVSWTASTDAGTTVTVQRGSGACTSNPTFTTLTTSAAAGGPYTDNSVPTGATSCYNVFASIGAVHSSGATFQFQSGVAPATGLTIVVQ